MELKFSPYVFKVELSSGTVPKIEWNGGNCKLCTQFLPNPVLGYYEPPGTLRFLRYFQEIAVTISDLHSVKLEAD